MDTVVNILKLAALSVALLGVTSIYGGNQSFAHSHKTPRATDAQSAVAEFNGPLIATYNAQLDPLRKGVEDDWSSLYPKSNPPQTSPTLAKMSKSGLGIGDHRLDQPAYNKK